MIRSSALSHHQTITIISLSRTIFHWTKIDIIWKESRLMFKIWKRERNKNKNMRKLQKDFDDIQRLRIMKWWFVDLKVNSIESQKPQLCLKWSAPLFFPSFLGKNNWSMVTDHLPAYNRCSPISTFLVYFDFLRSFSLVLSFKVFFIIPFSCSWFLTGCESDRLGRVGEGGAKGLSTW